jgi:hypothetical protein
MLWTDFGSARHIGSKARLGLPGLWAMAGAATYNSTTPATH